VSTCCPCVEQCFVHPMYGSEVRVNQPTCQEIFVGWGNSVFRYSVVGTDQFFSVFCSEPAVSIITCFGCSSSIFFGGLPCVLFVESTQFSFFGFLQFRRFSSSFLLRLRFLHLDHSLLSNFPPVWFPRFRFYFGFPFV